MSKGGSSQSKSTSFQNSVTRPAGWVEDASKSTLSDFDAGAAGSKGPLSADDIATGSTYVAPVDPMTASGVSDIGDHAFDYSPYYSSASTLLDPSAFDTQYNLGTGLQRSTDANGNNVVSFADFSPDNLQTYMNPYLTSVLQQGLDEIDRQNAIVKKNNNDAAVAASAFGGARHGVVESETERNAQQTRNQYTTQTLSDAYNAAIAARNAEREAAIQGLQMETDNRLKGASALEDLGTAAQTAGLKAGGAKVGAGAVLTENQQKVLDAAAAQKNKDLQIAMAKADLLKTLPSSTSTTSYGQTTEPVADPDTTGQLIGAGASILGGALAGPAGSAGATLLTSLFSDKRAKTDKKEISLEGEPALDAFSKVPVSRYKYKPGVETALGGEEGDEHVGPMAQDYADAFGGDGTSIGVGSMLGHLTQAVRELNARTSHLKKAA